MNQCLFCGKELQIPIALQERMKNSNLKLEDIDILHCPENHYTVHRLHNDNPLIKTSFSNYIYLENFEINRSYYEDPYRGDSIYKEESTYLYYKNKLLWKKDYCIDDDELIELFNKVKAKSLLDGTDGRK